MITAKEKAYKPKTCKACGNKFIPDRPLQSVCDWKCGLERAKQLQEIRAKKHKRKAIKQLNDSDWSILNRKAQVVFNAYIRERDREKPCVTCGATMAKWDCGHYLTRGARPEHRFNEMNASKQCVRCNLFEHGQPHIHRQKLIEQYGQEAIEAMEADRRIYKPTIEELKEIIKKYKQKIKDML